MECNVVQVPLIHIDYWQQHLHFQPLKLKHHLTQISYFNLREKGQKTQKTEGKFLTVDLEVVIKF